MELYVNNLNISKRIRYNTLAHNYGNNIITEIVIICNHLVIKIKCYLYISFIKIRLGKFVRDSVNVVLLHQHDKFFRLNAFRYQLTMCMRTSTLR